MTAKKQIRRKTPTPRLLHASDALRERMRLVQAVLFNGSLAKFATALRVNYGHLAHALHMHSRITVNMAAQVVAQTAVNARWLLTGEGPMLADTGAERYQALDLPPTINSSFAVLDPLTGVVPPRRVKKRPPVFKRLALSPPAIQVARRIYAARLADKPVTLFISREFCETGGLGLAEQLVAADYVTHIALTGCALPYLLPQSRRNTYTLDMLVRLAAANGVSLGEVLLRWAAPSRGAPQNILGQAAQKTAVVTVHVEPGEIPELFQPRTRGAEFGAQLGAATYVDSRVFAAQVLQAAGRPRGVVLACGEFARLARLYGSAVVALRTTAAASELKTFSIVTFNQTADVGAETALQALGGKVQRLKNSSDLKAVAELVSACNQIYAGLL